MLIKKNVENPNDVIWLNFFNKYLFENKLITESERNQIMLKINTMYSENVNRNKNGISKSNLVNQLQNQKRTK